MDSFYNQYLSIVDSADNLLSRPAIIKSETKYAIQDVECYCSHLSACLSALQKYPTLLESLFGLIEKNGMTGHLGEFIIDNAIQKCNEFSSLESEIQSEIDRVIEARSGSDTIILNAISEKAKAWHRIVSIDNLHYVGEFLSFLKQEVDKYYASLSAQERLGKALAQSEEERKRLLEMEEARKRGLSALELDKEEKRRKAREEFAKNIRTRKKR